jgi:hypothetical protein
MNDLMNDLNLWDMTPQLNMFGDMTCFSDPTQRARRIVTISSPIPATTGFTNLEHVRPAAMEKRGAPQPP